jgi:demethoxyubiquinone hydroxylase (CLK1/Coq7/Cat5 family)
VDTPRNYYPVLKRSYTPFELEYISLISIIKGEWNDQLNELDNTKNIKHLQKIRFDQIKHLNNDQDNQARFFTPFQIL